MAFRPFSWLRFQKRAQESARFVPRFDDYIRNGRRVNRTAKSHKETASIIWFGLIVFAVALAGLQNGTDLPSAQLFADRMARQYFASGKLDNSRNNSDYDAVVAGDTLHAQFGFCHTGGGTNCVVDGDTFWFEGRKIRIADIDTPETHPARCAAEAARGNAATQRLHALLNSGSFSLASVGRDTDRYGRSLRIVTRSGTSMGGILVNEGLARTYGGGMRDSWC